MMDEVGIVYAIPPEPLDPERTRFFEGAGIRIGVERRELDEDRVTGFYASNPEFAAQYEAVKTAHGRFADDGVTLHVIGPDGHEYLRFDCFRDEPHYHYVRRTEPGEPPHNHWIPLDEVANGDPLDWAIARLRTRLVPMLVQAGADAAAEAIAADADALPGLLDAVEAHARSVGSVAR